MRRRRRAGSNNRRIHWPSALGYTAGGLTVIILVAFFTMRFIDNQPGPTRLSIEITGLPGGTPAKVTVKDTGGPTTYTLKASDTREVPPGEYRITIGETQSEEHRHLPADKVTAVTVPDHGTTNVQAPYKVSINKLARIADEQDIQAVTEDYIMLRPGTYADNLKPGLVILGVDPEEKTVITAGVISTEPDGELVRAQVRQLPVPVIMPQMNIRIGDEQDLGAPGRIDASQTALTQKKPKRKPELKLGCEAKGAKTALNEPVITAGMGVTLAPYADMDVDWGGVHFDTHGSLNPANWKFSYEKPSGSAEVGLKTTGKAGVKIEVPVGFSCSIEERILLAELDKPCKAAAKLTGVGAVIDPKCQVYFKSEGELSASTGINVGMTAKATADVSGEYKIGKGIEAEVDFKGGDDKTDSWLSMNPVADPKLSASLRTGFMYLLDASLGEASVSVGLALEFYAPLGIKLDAKAKETTAWATIDRDMMIYAVKGHKLWGPEGIVNIFPHRFKLATWPRGQAIDAAHPVPQERIEREIGAPIEATGPIELPEDLRLPREEEDFDNWIPFPDDGRLLIVETAPEYEDRYQDWAVGRCPALQSAPVPPFPTSQRSVSRSHVEEPGLYTDHFGLSQAVYTFANEQAAEDAMFIIWERAAGVCSSWESTSRRHKVTREKIAPSATDAFAVREISESINMGPDFGIDVVVSRMGNTILLSRADYGDVGEYGTPVEAASQPLPPQQLTDMNVLLASELCARSEWECS